MFLVINVRCRWACGGLCFAFADSWSMTRSKCIQAMAMLRLRKLRSAQPPRSPTEHLINICPHHSDCCDMVYNQVGLLSNVSKLPILYSGIAINGRCLTKILIEMNEHNTHSR